jgi:hypothetical protein
LWQNWWKLYANQGDSQTQIENDDLIARWEATLINESVVAHHSKFTGTKEIHELKSLMVFCLSKLLEILVLYVSKCFSI